MTALFEIASPTPDAPPAGPPAPLEAALEAAVAALEAVEPLTPMQLVHVEVARSLARAIAGGVRKGRAIAGDVEAFNGVLAALGGTNTDTDRTLTDDDRAIIAALATPPSLDTAQASDAA